MAKLGKWLGRNVRKTLKVVSPHAVRTILQESGTSLTALKEVAKNNAVAKEADATDKQTKAQKLAVEAKALFDSSSTIKHALEELDSADGKL
jgi:pyrrolidone-carboxylate peptidase